MGVAVPSEIDRWINDGGRVVAASDRAARALRAAYDRARLTEGLEAWPAAGIVDWNSFVRTAWEERRRDGRLLLNSSQEQALWSQIAATSGEQAALLEGSRQRLAGLAMEAHALLCAYAPRLLRPQARAGWQQDSGVFSGWLAAFENVCRTGSLVSGSRLALELAPLLEGEGGERPALLLAGFDRILPAQRELLGAWGMWRQAEPGSPAARVNYYAASDTQAELTACARACRRVLEADAGARILVVTQEASGRRGQLERAFLRHAGAGFEFSLGLKLGQVRLAKAALLALRWLSEPLNEQEVDWLLATGHAAASAEESAALQRAMRRLRQRHLERLQWTLDGLLAERAAAAVVPAAWSERMRAGQRMLKAAGRAQSPLEWAALTPRLLETVGWPGGRALKSAELQAARRWQQAVDTAGSLGFDGRHVGWREFLPALERTLGETLFAPESRDAPIQIAGPAESAGLTADFVWMLGADEAAWPASGQAHPLLPLEAQREAGMPHATAQLDWELARAVTARLLRAGQEVCFSYAKQKEGVECRPSRLIEELAGAAQPMPAGLTAETSPEPVTEDFEDWSRVPFPPGKVEGGAAVLTAQSQCPFKAFATARLGAVEWTPAEAGLTPSQRGGMLHAVLHSVWAGPPEGIKSHKELVDLADLDAFAARHAARAMREEIPGGLRERMPRRYLELEEQRMARLVAEWLRYEAARLPFTVAASEESRRIELAGLALGVRLDRLDRLNDGTALVIDYKTGLVEAKVWATPRPEDVQLPLYAEFALNPASEPLGGLVFAKVRAGEMKFAGRVRDAAATLIAGLNGRNALVTDPLTEEQLKEWRKCIEELARAFVSGRAEVDPREYPKTCERCGLESLCRIRENPPEADEDEEGDDE